MNKLNRKQIFSIFLVVCLLSFYGCRNSANQTNLVETEFSTQISITYNITESDLSSQESINDNTNDISQREKNLLEYVEKELTFGDHAIFYDIDLDGEVELLFNRYYDFSYGYSIYELGDMLPEKIGQFSIVEQDNWYYNFSSCKGKFKRYYDKENDKYFIVSENLNIYDGSFEQVNYNALKLIFNNNKLEIEPLADFSGTICDKATNYKNYLKENNKYDTEWNCLYVDWNLFQNKPSNNVGVFDLNKQKNFSIEVNEYLKQYKCVDTVDFSNETKHTDAEEIVSLIIDYSSNIKSSEEIISLNEEETYSFMSQEYPVSTMHIDLYIDSNTEKDALNELKNFPNLYDLNILCVDNSQEINIDLSPLKNCKNLRNLCIPINLSDKSKKQLKDLTQLEFLLLDFDINSEDDYLPFKEISYLKYVAIETSNDDPDYFDFLYSNTNIEWIRFVNVTDEQIENVIMNMPNIKVITFGYSEV